jgi:hypothetical protein
MLLALALSLASIVMMTVFLLRTNKKLRKFVESFKLFCISSWVDKRMKPDNEYENFKEYEKNDEAKVPGTFAVHRTRIHRTHIK